MRENLARKWGDNRGIQRVVELASTTTDFVSVVERIGQAIPRIREPCKKTTGPDPQ